MSSTALELAPGDEVLTSDEEHPGLQGPLAAARAQARDHRARGAVRPDRRGGHGRATRLVACSHVSWISGARRAATCRTCDIPVLLDGAQGIGAVPTDVAALGCAFYAGSGQKWLCGPVGSGMLWVARGWRDRVPATRRPTSTSPSLPPASPRLPRADAARLDTSAQSLETIAARRRRARRAARRGLGRGARARRCAGGRARRRAHRRGLRRHAARRARRSCPGRTPIRRRRAPGSPRPAC